MNYTWGINRSNSEGAFAVSPTGTLATEWGPGTGGSFVGGGFSFGDIRHRLNLTLNNQIIKNLMVSLNVNASSGSPYTIRTGKDDNGDFVFNDRPAGIGRGTERGAAQLTLNSQFAYALGFGRQVGPQGVAVIGNGTAPTVMSVNAPPKYRVQVFVAVQNLTNRANLSGYSGTQTSQFFGRPTSVSGMRKVDFGVNLGF